jgi:hypothetical protein
VAFMSWKVRLAALYLRSWVKIPTKVAFAGAIFAEVLVLFGIRKMRLERKPFGLAIDSLQ